MKRGGPLKRKTGLKRGGRLRRRAKKIASLQERQAKELFEVAVLSGRTCVNCGQRAEDAHHILPKQTLKRVASERGLSEDRRIELLWDARNGAPLCRICHGYVTNRVIRLDWTQLQTAEVYAFAHDWLLESKMERELLDKGHVLDTLRVMFGTDETEEKS